jgi:hypothetical protein
MYLFRASLVANVLQGVLVLKMNEVGVRGANKEKRKKKEGPIPLGRRLRALDAEQDIREMIGPWNPGVKPTRQQQPSKTVSRPDIVPAAVWPCLAKIPMPALR